MTSEKEVAACLVTLPGGAFVEDGAHLFIQNRREGGYREGV